MSKVTNISDLKEAIEDFIRNMQAIGITPGVEVVNDPQGKVLIIAFTAEDMLNAIKEKYLDRWKDRVETSVIPFRGQYWLRILVRI